MAAANPLAVVQEHLGERGALLFEKILGQAPQKADAIVLLQGDQADRAPMALSLFQQRLAPLILISGNNVLVGPNTRPEESDFELALLEKYLVEHGVPASSVLIDDQAFNSFGQAVNAVRIAKERGWRTLLVVVSAYHALRAYLSFVKQAQDQGWNGTIVVHAVEFPWDSAPSGREKTACEMLELEMEKIQKYAKDIATIEAGLQYFKEL